MECQDLNEGVKYDLFIGSYPRDKNDNSATISAHIIRRSRN